MRGNSSGSSRDSVAVVVVVAILAGLPAPTPTANTLTATALTAPTPTATTPTATSTTTSWRGYLSQWMGSLPRSSAKTSKCHAPACVHARSHAASAPRDRNRPRSPPCWRFLELKAWGGAALRGSPVLPLAAVPRLEQVEKEEEEELQQQQQPRRWQL